MPRGKGEPISEQRENLTVFGEWFYFFCDYMETSMYAIARRSGISRENLSRNTRDPVLVSTAYPPSRETVEKVSRAFEQLAQEQGLPWIAESSAILFHSAGYATEQECEYTRQSLIIVKTFADRKQLNKERL